jgi:vancomycin aglycone glucosyltransferase
MRVLLAVFGTRGDGQPALALALRLRQQGHEALVLGAEGFAEQARGLGIPFQACGLDFERESRGTPQLLELSREGGQAMLELMQREAPSTFQQTRDAAERFNPELIVGASYPLAAPTVAELLGVPYRALFYAPPMVPSFHWPPSMVKSQTLPRWVNGLLWWATGKFMGGHLLRMANAQRAAWGLAEVRDALSYLFGRHPLVASSPALVPLGPCMVDEPVQTGALVLPEATQELAPEVESFLRAGPPPVYIGFGSMPDRDPVGTTRKVLAAVERAGLRAILGAGWSGLGREVALPENVLGVGNVPHGVLFPRLAGVVHHGGAGTTTAAARAGVPQLIVPHLADQFFWGHHIHQRGLGPVSLRRERLGEGLASALQQLVSTPSYAEKARQVAAELALEDGCAVTIRELERQVEQTRPGARTAAA